MTKELNGAVLGRMPRLFLRAGVSVMLAALFLWLLSTRLAEVDPAAVGRAMSGLPALQWGLALAATALSFWAVGQYDAVVHRALATGIAPALARRAGICAIAISQMLGMGVITGTVVRLRMLPGQPPALAARLTVAVALSFLAGWAVVTALVLLFLPDAPFRGLAAAGLAGAVLVTAAGLTVPGLARGWPNLFSQARLVGLAAVDTLAAALALFVLLPPELGLSFAVLLPVFLIAQGAGLVSGAPGGVGAFEATLLVLLPQVPQEPLLAAILAWRVVYYALPAVLAGVFAALAPRSTPPARPTALTHYAATRAETGIEAQGEHRRLPSGDWLVGQTPHMLVGLFDPLQVSRAALPRLAAAAQGSDRWPAIYKCTARTAVLARAQGWQVTRLAREAWLDPRSFDLAAPERSGLRRKRRRAAAADVLVLQEAPLPLAEMAQVAAAWRAAHGGERGFSMGRFAPAYVAGQQVYLARHKGRLVGFATFHRGVSEWVLDLMRLDAGAPDGTMQTLVTAAIEDAGRRGLPRLSLAAVPEAAFGRAGALHRGLARLGHGSVGLWQFKAGFAPHWQPLYLAAPHRAALTLAALEVARAVACPPALRETEQDHAEIGFATDRSPWQRRANMSQSRGSDVR